LSVRDERDLPMPKKKVNHRETADLTRVVRYLEQLTEGLRLGTIFLTNGEQQLLLSPSNNAVVEIEGSQKEEKESLRIELAWTKVKKITESSNGFHIETKAPELISRMESAPATSESEVVHTPEAAVLEENQTEEHAAQKEPAAPKKRK
jgi:amphi-Trp domain-containing protein